MNVLLATFVVVGFAVTLESLHLPARACEVGQCSTECLDVLRDDSLSDREKEEALQQRARRLFKLWASSSGEAHSRWASPCSGSGSSNSSGSVPTGEPRRCCNESTFSQG